MLDLEVKPHKIISVKSSKKIEEKSKEELPKELDKRAEDLEAELQVKMNVDLQKLITHYCDNTAWDAMSIISMAKLLTDSYYDLIKERWSTYNKNPEDFVAAAKEDLKKLAETVEE